MAFGYAAALSTQRMSAFSLLRAGNDAYIYVDVPSLRLLRHVPCSDRQGWPVPQPCRPLALGGNWLHGCDMLLCAVICGRAPVACDHMRAGIPGDLCF